MANAATRERNAGEPQSPTSPVKPEIWLRLSVSSQSEIARISKTNMAARHSRRPSNPDHSGGQEVCVNGGRSGFGPDSTLDLGINGESVHSQTSGSNCTRMSGLSKEIYRFRLPRKTSNAPESSASALTPEDGSISGTATAIAAPDTPIASNNIPVVFKYTSKAFPIDLVNPVCSGRFLSRATYRFRRPRTTSNAPESSASALTPEDGSISGTVGVAITTPDTPIASNSIPIAFKVHLLFLDLICWARYYPVSSAQKRCTPMCNSGTTVKGDSGALFCYGSLQVLRIPVPISFAKYRNLVLP